MTSVNNANGRGTEGSGGVGGGVGKKAVHVKVSTIIPIITFILGSILFS